MDEMLALLGEHPSCFLFRQLFLEHLLEDMRAQLIDANIDDSLQLARKANSSHGKPTGFEKLDKCRIILTAWRWNQPPPLSKSCRQPRTYSRPQGLHCWCCPAASTNATKAEKETATYIPWPLLITTVCLVQKLADASNRSDGRETRRLGVSRGHDIQPHGRPAFCTGQNLWRPVFGWHRSGSQFFLLPEWSGEPHSLVLR